MPTIVVHPHLSAPITLFTRSSGEGAEEQRERKRKLEEPVEPTSKKAWNAFKAIVDAFAPHLESTRLGRFRQASHPGYGLTLLRNLSFFSLFLLFFVNSLA